MSNFISWPGSDGTAFDVRWTTQTIANGGGGGSDTFLVQSALGRIGCVAASANSKQHVKYTNANGAHTKSFDYRGTINLSAVGNETTNFIVRSDNLTVADSNYHQNCYVFELDTTVNTVAAYKVIASTPAAITGAAAATSFTYSPATTYSVHFSLIDYTLAVTIWTGAEPGTPTYTCTDPDNSILNTTSGKFAWTNQHIAATATNIDLGNAVFVSNFDPRTPGKNPAQAIRRASTI